MTTKKKLKEAIKKNDLNAINDPFEMLADVLLENKRLRKIINKCDCK